MWVHRILIAVLVASALGWASGCSVDRRYDLSGTEPFAAYAGRSVALTRDVLLVDTSEGHLALVDPSLPDQLEYAAVQQRQKQALRQLVLPAGTKVHVDQTYLWCRGQLGTYFSYLQSRVTIGELKAPGWPARVEAGFSHAAVTANDWFQLFMYPFREMIRPAPWEPLDTPTVRPFPKPRDLRPMD